MFAIYKAMTAVKLAEEATAAGIDAVPVFWLATSDHDLAEVNHVSMPGSDGLLHTLVTSSHGVAGAPVSDVRLGDEILPVVEEAASLLGDSEAAQFLRESYRPGETLGTAFARFYARLFSAPWGVILLDASDAELHRVAVPVYRAAIERAEELDAALLTRGAALDSAGYYQQVKVAPSSVAAFCAARRRAARGDPSPGVGANQAAEFVIGGEPRAAMRAARAKDEEKLSAAAELLDRIDCGAGTLPSPNVLLRPVEVQDYLIADARLCGRSGRSGIFRAGRRGVRAAPGPCDAYRAALFGHSG